MLKIYIWGTVNLCWMAKAHMNNLLRPSFQIYNKITFSPTWFCVYLITSCNIPPAALISNSLHLRRDVLPKLRTGGISGYAVDRRFGMKQAILRWSYFKPHYVELWTKAEANRGLGVEWPSTRPFVGNSFLLSHFVGFECLLLDDFEEKRCPKAWTYER